MNIKKVAKDFKEFAIQGNVMNLAVGVMIGGAFSKIVTSLVNDIFTPVLGIITGGVANFSDLSLKLGSGDSAPTLNYGAFLSNIIDFFLIAICIFMVVKLIAKLAPQKPEKPKAPEKPKRECPFCFSEINAAATRCPSCTSMLTEDGQYASN